MNKNRLEALSDGVFSIVMTILIFDVKIPTLAVVDDAHFTAALVPLAPLLASYFVSFTVLAMFWVSHNYFYGSFTLIINRQLVLLNMLYLSLIALIPFSARLVGEYASLKGTVIIYGINVLLIGIVASTVLHYAIRSDEIDISHVSSRLLKQARIRSLLTPVFTFFGIVAAAMNGLPLALFLFAFPIVFNMVPGTLDFTERLLRTEI